MLTFRAPLLLSFQAPSTSYLFLGIRAFAGCGRDELVRRIKGSPLPASRLRRYLLAGGSGPTFTLGITAIAFGTIITTVHERANATYLVVGLVAATITACWMTITFAFALHYARVDIEAGGLEFSGTEQATLSDYGYVAIGCSATFGTTDTSITTSRMRRIVSVHGVIALFFDTVVIAVLLSVIIS